MWAVLVPSAARSRSAGEAAAFTIAAALGCDFADDPEDDRDRHRVEEVDTFEDLVVDTVEATGHQKKEDPDCDLRATTQFGFVIHRNIS